jgi:hypothetical protein
MGKPCMHLARRMSASQCSHTVGTYGSKLIDFDIVNGIPCHREIKLYVFFLEAEKKIHKTVEVEDISKSQQLSFHCAATNILEVK